MKNECEGSKKCNELCTIVFIIVLFVFFLTGGQCSISGGNSGGKCSISYAEEKTEKDEVYPIVAVEVKKDVSVNEFYDTNSAIRSRMFYQTFLERFAKANNMAAGGFDVLPVGIYFIPVDAVFFKMTKSGIYAAIVINAEPGMTLSEFYATNSLVNRKLGWDFFKERFAEFQGIPNEEKEFQKLKPGAWIIPIPMVEFLTPEGIKSETEMNFIQTKGEIYKAEIKKVAAPKEPIKKEKKSVFNVFIIILLVVAILLLERIVKFLFAKKEEQKDQKKKEASQNKTTYI